MTLPEARAIVVDLAYDRPDLDALLHSSRGENFRPYLVAAVALATAKNTRRLTRAGEVSFTEATREAVDNLLQLQSVQDAGDKQVPTAWTVGAFAAQFLARPTAQGSIRIPARVVW